MENQLRGRVDRPPQQKTVHVYHIIAADTQDVFLNNNSFSKGAVQDAFTRSTPNIRALPRTARIRRVGESFQY